MSKIQLKARIKSFSDTQGLWYLEIRMLRKNDKYVLKEEQERLGLNRKKKNEGNSEDNDKGKLRKIAGSWNLQRD